MYMQRVMGEIRPHFIITGATGSGKTHTVMQVADECGIPLISINAAQLTTEGIAGNSLSKALSGLKDFQGKSVIVFLDEFDKASAGSTELTSGGVQQEILKILEDDTTEVFGAYGKYERIQTKNVLFVFGGSFNGAEINSLADLKDHNIKPELLGRIGLHFSTEKPTLKDMEILVKKSKLLDNYCDLFSESVNRKKAEAAILKELGMQYDGNIIGIRIINSLIHQYFIVGEFTSLTKRSSPKNKTGKLQLSVSS